MISVEVQTSHVDILGGQKSPKMNLNLTSVNKKVGYRDSSSNSRKQVIKNRQSVANLVFEEINSINKTSGLVVKNAQSHFSQSKPKSFAL